MLTDVVACSKMDNTDLLLYFNALRWHFELFWFIFWLSQTVLQFDTTGSKILSLFALFASFLCFAFGFMRFSCSVCLLSVAQLQCLGLALTVGSGIVGVLCSSTSSLEVVLSLPQCVYFLVFAESNSNQSSH